MNLTKRGNDLSTKEYRKLTNISYSDIKLWLTDRKKFYKTKILGEQVIEKPSDAKIIGDLIHCKILEPQNYDNLFCTAPVHVSGQMGDLAYAMYERSVKYMDDKNSLTVHISVVIDEALNQVKYNGKGEEVAFKGKDVTKVIDMFNESPAEQLYAYLRSNHGKTVISPYQDEKASKIVEGLRESPYTSKWINAVSEVAVDVHNELPVVFQHEGVEVKSLIDRMVVDHNNKEIHLLDVKSSWDTERFERNYLNLCYYIQACIYNLAAIWWAKEQGIENYNIIPMKYIVADSQGYMQPVVYNCTDEDIIRAYNGFTVRGYQYTGLQEALADIKYGIDTGVWNIDRAVVAAQGNAMLDIPYQVTM